MPTPFVCGVVLTGGTSMTACLLPARSLVRIALRCGVGTGSGRDGVGAKTHCWVLREQPHLGCGGFFGSKPAPVAFRGGGCGDGRRAAGPAQSAHGFVGGWVSGTGGGPGRCLRTAQWTRASLFSVVEVYKGTGWMPWHQEPKKDVVACDMPRGVGKRTVIRGSPNGETPYQSCGTTRT